jgi:hypothetical protein
MAGRRRIIIDDQRTTSFRDTRCLFRNGCGSPIFRPSWHGGEGRKGVLSDIEHGNPDGTDDASPPQIIPLDFPQPELDMIDREPGGPGEPSPAGDLQRRHDQRLGVPGSRAASGDATGGQPRHR